MFTCQTVSWLVTGPEVVVSDVMISHIVIINLQLLGDITWTHLGIPQSSVASHSGFMFILLCRYIILKIRLVPSNCCLL